MLVCNFATRKKTNQRHIAQSVAYQLQLSTGRTKVRPTPASTTDIDRTCNIAGGTGRGIGAVSL